MQEHAARVAQWKEQEAEAAQRAVQLLSAILTFPGGWLCDLNEDGTPVPSGAFTDRTRALCSLATMLLREGN